MSDGQRSGNCHADEVATAELADGQLSRERVGRVVLVGGGPGDPGLLTRRGHARLLEADVVVTDRLAPTEILAELPAHVEVINVAKIPRGPSTSQDEINRLLVQHAGAGRTVVRLKGGDSFVFGRGAEEVEACVAAGIPVEVVPGVTSAVAVPAAVGIPLTHRALVQGFTVVSAHLRPDDPRNKVDWAVLARSGMTLVIMMGVLTLPQVSAALIEAGMDSNTPVACIENGGLPGERTLSSPLRRIADVARKAGLMPPAIIVVGEVTALRPPAVHD